MGLAKKKSHLRKNKMLGGFRSVQDRLQYLIGFVSDDKCLNLVLDRMDESRKRMVLAILNSK